jgi:cysteine-rich repeat protein
MADCDGAYANGCETDLTTLTNCGACGTQCSAPANASAICNSAGCGFHCNLGYSLSGGMCVSTAASCGDRAIESGETCDDGNMTAGDGCSPSCQLEQAPSDSCSGIPTLTVHMGTQCYAGSQCTSGTSCVSGASNAEADDFYCTRLTGAYGHGPDVAFNVVAMDGGIANVQLIPASATADVIIGLPGTSCMTGQALCINGNGPGQAESLTYPVAAGSHYVVVADSLQSTGGTLFELCITIN